MWTCPDRTLLAGLLALMLLHAALAPASASAPGDEPSPTSLTIQGTMVGGNPFYPGQGASPYKVTIFSRGDKSRVDIETAEGEQAIFLMDGESRHGWIVSLDHGVALPTSATGIGPLQLDPVQPCVAIDARCERSGQRFMAGQVAQGWRFRGAQGRGPGGTSEGVVWLDEGTGTVLGYNGTRFGRGSAHSMEADFVSHQPLPDEIFQVPVSVELSDPAAR